MLRIDDVTLPILLLNVSTVFLSNNQIMYIYSRHLYFLRVFMFLFLIFIVLIMVKSLKTWCIDSITSGVSLVGLFKDRICHIFSQG